MAYPRSSLSKGFSLSVLVLGVMLALGVVPGCKSSSGTTDIGFLDPTDLEPYKAGDDVEGTPIAYDRNNLLDDASLVDFSQASGTIVQQYLERTPYGKRSFLGTYQSNGLRAADAIADASRNYRVNPIALLVLSQIRGGLVSLQIYPSDPARVEYAFECGCQTKGACEPRLAGFDRQIDCVAQKLREAIESVRLNGVTASGFGPNRTSFTVDGARVTPANAATAAILQVLPREAVNAPGGTWLFWNLWQKFAEKYGYSGPFEPNPEGSGIGEACQVDAQCSGIPKELSPICATNYPGGLCTTNCTGECPEVPGRAKGYCADFRAQGGYCLAVCNPSAPNCRSGYSCTRVVKFGDSKASEYTCYPQ